MNADPASLDRLHDIVVPPPVPWWPPAPGWLWLLGLVSLLAAMAALRWFAHRQRNRYRREALAELSRLEADAGDASKRATALAGLSALLKRTALTAYGREPVAALTGAAWFAFLDRTGGTRFGDGLGRALESSVYRAGAADETVASDDLVGEIGRWIRAHGPLPETPEPGQAAAQPTSVDRAA